MTAPAAATGPVRVPLAPRIAVAAAFAVGFLWQAFGAVSNLVSLAGLAALLGRQLNAVVWIVLVVGVVIPVAAYAAGLVVGRRRRPGLLAVVLLVALCTAQALSLSQLAFFQSVIGVL